MKALITASLLFSLLLSGCAGSTTAEIEPRLRTLQTGDRWVLSGQSTAPGWAVDYVDTIQVANEELGGALYPSFRHTMVMDGQDPRTFADIFTQNSQTQELTLIGTLKGEVKEATAHQMLMPGSFFLGQEWTVHYDETAGENYVVCKVVAREVVGTPLGEFRAWKLHATIHAGENSAESDLWMVPEMGYYVKIVSVSGNTTNSEAITNTNVPYQRL